MLPARPRTAHAFYIVSLTTVIGAELCVRSVGRNSLETLYFLPSVSSQNRCTRYVVFVCSIAVVFYVLFTRVTGNVNINRLMLTQQAERFGASVNDILRLILLFCIH